MRAGGWVSSSHPGDADTRVVGVRETTSRNRTGCMHADDVRVGQLQIVRSSGLRRLPAVALFAGFPALIVGILAWATSRGGRAGFDFAIFRTAGAAVSHGHSPYVSHPTLRAACRRYPLRIPDAVRASVRPVRIDPRAHRRRTVPAALRRGRGRRAAVARRARLAPLWTSVMSWPVVFSALGLGTLGPALLLAVAAGWRLLLPPHAGACHAPPPQSCSFGPSWSG